MISLQRLLYGFLYLIVAGAIFALLYWALGEVHLPNPFGYAAHLLLIFGIVVTIIGILLWMVGIDIFKPAKPCP